MDIGKPERHEIIEPIEDPTTVPKEAPPEEAPAAPLETPEREPVPA